MLVLSRKKNESIVINDDITIMVVEIRGDKVRLGIEAPQETPVHRSEVYEAIQRENRKSNGNGTPQTVTTADATATAAVTASATVTPNPTATASATTADEKKDEEAEAKTPMRPPPQNIMNAVAVTIGYLCITGLSSLGGYTIITWIGGLLKPWLD